MTADHHDAKKSYFWMGFRYGIGKWAPITIAYLIGLFMGGLFW